MWKAVLRSVYKQENLVATFNMQGKFLGFYSTTKL